MFSFPWSNFHELNLDWILSVVKEAKDIFVRGEGDIQHAVETADQALETAEQAAAAVIADGAVTIPKVNDAVFNLMAFIVSGSVNPVAIPAGSLVILRKSTVYNVSDGIYVAASDIPASSVLTAADLLQPSPLPDAGGLNYVLAQIGDTETAIDAIQRGLVTVVDGDTATSAIPAGALAYLKNNTHNLQEGLYANISNAPFPTTGGTADSSVFSAVPNVLNSIRDITGDGVLTGFTATDLTGAANELKTTANTTAASVNAIEEAIAYVQIGDSASRTYTEGQFVYLKNHPTLAEGLYKVNNGNIPSGTSVSGHLTADSNGGLNTLNDAIFSRYLLTYADGTTTAWAYKTGSLVALYIPTTTAQTVAAWGTIPVITSLPAELRPPGTIRFPVAFQNAPSDAKHTSLVATVNANGSVYIENQSGSSISAPVVLGCNVVYGTFN